MELYCFSFCFAVLVFIKTIQQEVAISSNFPLNYIAKLQFKTILKSILCIIFYDSIINKLILEDKKERF
jgi:hypothetical protein